MASGQHKLTKSAAGALGRNIRTVREVLGLSQGQFAEKVGVTQQKVSQWERGKHLRQVVEAWRLAEVLSQKSSRRGSGSCA